MDEIAILIMAAGGSKRLGRAKQLLTYKGDTLLNHTINTCLLAALGPVYLVLGSGYDLIVPTITDSNCKIYRHVNWNNGISSSIAFGLSQLNTQEIKGLIVVLADQPFLSKEILIEMQKEVLKGAAIVNCAYEQGQGAPTYFDRKYFDELKLLAGDAGAKGLVKLYQEELVSVSFLKGHLDIDKPSDLSLLDL